MITHLLTQKLNLIKKKYFTIFLKTNKVLQVNKT